MAKINRRKAKSTVMTSFMIEIELKEKLEKEAKRQDKSKSLMLNDLLREYLK